MNTDPINILIIEDNPGDARLIQELLREVNPGGFSFFHADCLSRGMGFFDTQKFDLILLDLSLPDSSGLETFSKVQTHAPNLPIILLTGHDDQEMALRSVRLGAQDYLVKGEYEGKLIARAIQYAIQRKLTEIKLRESEQRYEQAAREKSYLYERAQQEIRERITAEKQLQLTQFTVDHVTDSVIWMKPDASLIYSNHAASKALGYSQDELLAMKFHDLGTPELVRQTWNRMFSELRYERSLTLESQLQRKDGIHFPVEIAFNPIKFDNNQFICAIIRDITDRKLMEEQLRLHADNLDQVLTQRTLELAGERIRTRTILEALGEAVLVSDKDLRIQYVNKAATQLTGYPKEELQGQKLELWRSARQTSELSPSLFTESSNGNAWRGEAINQRKDGTVIDTAVTIAPMYEHDGDSQPIGYVSVQRDITALKEAERIKYRFVSNVSHELRTPLSILTIMADNLSALYDTLSDEKRRELVQGIRDHTLGLNDLVTSVLEISRIDSGEIAYTHDLLDCAAIIQAETEKLIALAKRKKQSLIISGEGPLYVQGNAGQLRQIIRNLVNNAIKYTPQEGTIHCDFQIIHGTGAPMPKWPKAHTLPGGKWAGLRVEDSGIGISDENLPHIFERFYRVDSEGSVPGAGLGLSIAKELVNLHAGYLTVASEPGQGSIFCVYLPLVMENQYHEYLREFDERT